MVAESEAVRINGRGSEDAKPGRRRRRRKIDLAE